jgi:hypothetical protein
MMTKSAILICTFSMLGEFLQVFWYSKIQAQIQFVVVYFAVFLEHNSLCFIILKNKHAWHVKNICMTRLKIKKATSVTVQ